MKYPDINLLKTFIALCETRNFTQTARRVHRTQSAVSMQISKLEEQLDCELFIRDKRNVKLTNNGLKLKDYANQIVGLSDKLIDDFKHTDIDGEISFASPEDFATYYLPAIFSEFISIHPRVKLNVNCDLTLNLINDFEKDKYDLIVIKQPPGKLYSNAKPLIREELVWVGNDESIINLTFSKVKNHYLRKMGHLPLVLSPAPCVYRERALESLDKVGVDREVIYTSPSFAGAIAAVRAGLGFTVLPREMVPEDLIIYEASRNWPKLKQAEICLLAGTTENPAIHTLSEFISERIAFIGR